MPNTSQRHLITSAIPYVNGVKHLGNLIGSMLPADVFARFCRQQGHETLFICGTDDHGTPAELGAIKAREQPAPYVVHWHAFQKDIYQRFGLSFNHFGSSSRPQNTALTQHLAHQLFKQGLLEIRTETMLYSHEDQRFLPDRYVEGQCPKCSFAKARGDQCDGCGSVLNPTDLINPYSSISGSHNVELKQTSHIYLKQSQLVPQLRAWIDEQTHWPKLSRSIAYKWLDEGLQDRGITRDLKWGVPVPPDLAESLGDPTLAQKVFYVWFDAPIAYIAATQEWATAQHGETQPTSGIPLSPQAARWWLKNQGAQNNESPVHYTQFMGKDNVYFHTLSFPSTLIGSGEPWNPVSTLKSYNWLTYYGGKFSTSQGVGIFTDKALELLPPDYWRYYLLARAPEGDDSEFRWPELQSVVNKDLADVLGNFINRTLTFNAKHHGTSLPPLGEITQAETTLHQNLQTTLQKLSHHLAEAEMRKSAEALRELWSLGNEYLAAEEPWKALKTNPARAQTILHTAIQLIPFYAATMAPLIPHTAEKIIALFPQLQTPQFQAYPWPTHSHPNPTLTQVATPTQVLFQKITDDQVAEWETQFGNQKA